MKLDMNQDFFITLTFAVYRVLELFPDDESVKSKIAESANRTLSDLILISEKNPVTTQQKREIIPRCLREIELVQVYLRETQDENWINPDNFLVLRKAYRKVERFLEDLDLDIQDRVQKEKSKPSFKIEQKFVEQKKEAVQLSGRKLKIVEILKNKEQAQVREFQKMMPNVTKRTLRRDLDELIHLGFIERKGEWSKVFYRIKT